jgi:hypothetical protein
MFKKELSKEDIAKLKETIRTKIRERKIEEENSTASADGYNTPFAFGKDTKGDIKRKVKSAGDAFTFAKSIDENRWLELKRDETRTPSQKVSHGIRELKNQLSEIEKFMGWYSKLKSETQLGKGDFFKRTENNIRKIKERIIKMANTIKEIDSDDVKTATDALAKDWTNNNDQAAAEVSEDQGVKPKKPMAVDKYVVTATPKGASKNTERRTITQPAPKNSAQTQLKSLTKMDKYQSVRLKKA